MNVQRSWATPIAAGAFLLSAVTGVLIFFHVDSGLNKAAHEWLSWLLLGGVVLHVLANLGGFKRHFATRGGLAVMGAFALVLALSFIAPAAELSPNGFKTVVDIDLNGTFHVLRLAYPLLKKPGASIINISAPQGVNPTMYQVHACAAKAGIDMMTRVLAMEWGGAGVRVNAIAPGPIADTEGMRRLAPSPEALAKAVASVPLQRMGTLQDVAHMAMLLASPQAG